ncbi:MAG: DNA-binding protein YbaB, partial [Kiritimatiellia bacterium]
CTDVKIAPEAYEDPELFEDLIRAATNEALRKAREETKKNMGELASGLPIPPGLIPGM